MCINHDDCFIPSGMMVSFTMPGKEGQTHNYTRNYMRTHHNNVLRYDFMTIHRMINTGRPAKVTTVKRGNENKIIWECVWEERPPIGLILNLSPIYMCPFCDAPVADVEESVLLTCGFCGGVFSKDDAI